MDNKSVKLFKWIGGKKWLTPKLENLYNKNIPDKNKLNYYIEPFCGGLGSFLYLIPVLTKKNITNVILNDVNSSLINVYNQIKNNPNKLFQEYSKFEIAYKKKIEPKLFSLSSSDIKNKNDIKKSLTKTKNIDYFYQCREKFNNEKGKNTTKEAALFLFLSQHSFNGIYRENKSGFYNTPYNWAVDCPNLQAKEHKINEYSLIFNTLNISFENLDVFEFLDKHIEKSNEALFYFDPPYLNIKQVENKYHESSFSFEEQKKLFEYYKKVDNLVFSNHNLAIFKDFCDASNINRTVVNRSNVMNPKSEKRSKKVSEILAYKFF